LVTICWAIFGLSLPCLWVTCSLVSAIALPGKGFNCSIPPLLELISVSNLNRQLIEAANQLTKWMSKK
jgi:hypothetical protein